MDDVSGSKSGLLGGSFNPVRGRKVIILRGRFNSQVSGRRCNRVVVNARNAGKARAKACGPSYIAIGTVYETTSKVMDYPPLGIEAFKRMARLSDVPVVAIGGIHLDNAAPLFHAGADGCAVISEIRDAPDLDVRVDRWKRIQSC